MFLSNNLLNVSWLPSSITYSSRSKGIDGIRPIEKSEEGLTSNVENHGEIPQKNHKQRSIVPVNEERRADLISDIARPLSWILKSCKKLLPMFLLTTQPMKTSALECAEGFFLCQSGECKPESSNCNDSSHCPDGSCTTISVNDMTTRLPETIRVKTNGGISEGTEAALIVAGGCAVVVSFIVLLFIIYKLCKRCENRHGQVEEYSLIPMPTQSGISRIGGRIERERTDDRVVMVRIGESENNTSQHEEQTSPRQTADIIEPVMASETIPGESRAPESIRPQMIVEVDVHRAAEEPLPQDTDLMMSEKPL